VKMPGILPLVFFVCLVPALTPVIQRFWPIETSWPAAVAVVLLGAASSAVWIIYSDKLAKLRISPPGTIAPAATPAPPGTQASQAPQPPRSRSKRWLLG
jgi:hypothetical protein